MVWRRRVIFTRSSREASSAGEGARTWMAAAVCATGVGAAAARSIAASMSPLVTRPSLPEPGTVDGSMPVSAAILRTEGGTGMSGVAARRRRRGCGFGRGAARRASGAAGARLGGARAVGDLTEQRADRDRLAVLGGDRAEHAGGRRRDLDRHLVGLELDQRLVDRDRIARLLEPLADRRLGHRFAERGHADVGHASNSFRRHAQPRAGIHVFAVSRDVDGRAKRGHDGRMLTPTPLRGTP